ncbi:family 43 glycosylhydrolase [Sphingomonas abietis]|uniref:Family 43 glycosylhydrolase n=1 Tax=Sphingomonas abietis TaxID=3012344 RepID=A0ABY7NJ48_9SPHN|nr:family 43 glycosylhydrolase [Sphingomonas abietis]WBO21551.1 family 43 glycosylhydrolase [Sphingomonas abietis]
MSFSRRSALATMLAGTAAASRATGMRSAAATPPAPGRGADGQRIADLGDGTFINPIMAGDHPDPTILKDGGTYYMTFSSFLSYPGLVIWRSTDLVNWHPVGPALHQRIGTVWAVDLVRHEGRYFLYIPAAQDGEEWRIYAIWADRIEGPWSDPVDLGIRGCIDPCHVVGEDGKRYLFTNGVRRVRLADDGLSTIGAVEPAYAPWRYPDDWIVENFAPEGPKLLRHGDYFYLVTAVGGTAGPATGHMVIAARSRSIHGPWEDCPHNPIVRTRSIEEPWWSRGHATLVEGPAGDWWMVYHGYENGFRTLGRQTLLQPVDWTDDGWFRASGGCLSTPIAKPKEGRSGPSAPALSDDFSADRMGVQWSFHEPGPNEAARLQRGRQGAVLEGRGTGPADTAPLTCIVRDRCYQAEISIDLLGDAEAGLLLFYNHKAFVGIGFTPEAVKLFEYSDELSWARKRHDARTLRLRVRNDEHVVTYHYSYDEGRTWMRHDTRMEVSGLHHNVFGGFLSLKIALYAVGTGSVRLRDFHYDGNPAPVIETKLDSFG